MSQLRDSKWEVSSSLDIFFSRIHTSSRYVGILFLVTLFYRVEYLYALFCSEEESEREIVVKGEIIKMRFLVR